MMFEHRSISYKYVHLAQPQFHLINFVGSFSMRILQVVPETGLLAGESKNDLEIRKIGYA